MGVIAQLASGSKVAPRSPENGRLWQQFFSVSKEDPNVQTSLTPRALANVSRVSPVPASAPQGWGNSLVNNPAAGRLLQALRSRAPISWTDNRYIQAAHYTGITFVSIFRLARAMSQAEFQVTIDDPLHPDGKRPVTEMDPPNGDLPFVRPWDLVQLLKRPNPQDSFGKLLMRRTIQKYLTGTALTWKVPNAFGIPMELYPIETVLATPQPVYNAEYPDGYYRIQPLYPTSPYGGLPPPSSASGAIIPAQWMMADRFPHPIFRNDGYSPLTGMKLHIDEVESMDSSRWYKMKRSVKPNLILQMLEAEGMQPLKEEEIERIRAEIESEFMGPENWGKLIVGHPGCELQVQNDSEEIDYYQGWEQLVSFVMGGFGITKEACGMISDASYAALFATLKQLNVITLDPECQDIGQEMTRDLCPHFGRGLEVTLRVKRIDDHEVTFNKCNILMSAKAITKNEVRKTLDFPLTQEPWGNDIAGDPSPNETLMQTQLAMMALPDETEEQATGTIKPGGLDNVKEEAPEVTQSRPGTGGLGKGSRGPSPPKEIKSLISDKVNRIREYYVKEHANGNGRHSK